MVQRNVQRGRDTIEQIWAENLDREKGKVLRKSTEEGMEGKRKKDKGKRKRWRNRNDLTENKKRRK